MKRTIAELKAVVDYYESEGQRINALRNEAMRKLCDAEDALKRNKKLTSSQLKILRKLGDGAVIKQSNWTHQTRYWWEQKDSYGDLSRAVFFGLLERKVIASRKDESSRNALYAISDWGRDILSRQVPEAQRQEGEGNG